MHSQNLFLFFTFVLIVTCCTFEAHLPRSQDSIKSFSKQLTVSRLIRSSNH